MTTVPATPPPPPDRYEPLPSLLELPGFLLRKLTPARRRMALAVLALLVLAGVGVAVLVAPGMRSDARERQAAAERARQAASAERRDRAARLARPRTGKGPAAAGLDAAGALRARRALVAGLEAAVLADVRGRARRGVIERRSYRAAACFEFPKAVGGPPPQDDLGRPSARLECLAATSIIPADERTTGSLVGQPFRARADFERGRYAWCLIVGRPGELVIERERVLAVPRACGGSG